MSTPCHCRTATPADLPAIAARLEELSIAENSTTQASAASLADALFPATPAPVRLRALVAERSEDVLGVILYYAGYDTSSASYGYHLADMAVAPAARGQGVGRALYAALAEQCLAEGGQWISLTVLKDNPRAQAFYGAVGMQEVPVDFYAIGPKGLRMILPA